MNIGEAAKQSAVSAKMIRHYEELGLLPRVPRTESGYRQYDEATVHTLRFIRRARDLGFGLSEIETLLGLWRNRRRSSKDVKRIALEHAADLQRRIEELQHLAHREIAACWLQQLAAPHEVDGELVDLGHHEHDELVQRVLGDGNTPTIFAGPDPPHISVIERSACGDGHRQENLLKSGVCHVWVCHDERA